MRRNLLPALKKSSTLVILITLYLLVLADISIAQTETGTTGLSRVGTNSGKPTGSYQLNDFENINYLNGNLNFSLPLVNIGGRGEAGYTIPLNIEQKWSLRIFDMDNDPDSQILKGFPYPSDWGNQRKYAPGVMEARNLGVLRNCDGQGSTPTIKTQTRLSFISIDGTETELRDINYNGDEQITIYGAQNGGNCILLSTVNRGRIFASYDGSGITFISDVDIYDEHSPVVGSNSFTVSGYLAFPNGTRYRISENGVEWIRDRNGNKISANTDSLNRKIEIYYTPLPTQTNPDQENFDLYTFKGNGGSSKTIKVQRQKLSQTLRNGSVAKTDKQLFPEIDYHPGVVDKIDDYNLVSSVELPDGKSYQFKYNEYGELARVELPTGGAIEYEHAAGYRNHFESGFISLNYGGRIYRRIVERRVYKDKNSAIYENKLTISRPETYSGGNDGYVDVELRDYSGVLLSKERHYYHGTSGTGGSPGLGYTGWKSNKEWKTEKFSTDGSTVIQRIENTWEQPILNSKWPLTQSESSASVKTNNPKITKTVTTLVDTNQVSMLTFEYDEFLNQTKVNEYDYGYGAPGALLRTTKTSYLRQNPYQNNVDYAADLNIHIKNLPLQSSILDKNGTVIADTHYSYDYYGADGLPQLQETPGIVNHDGAFHSGYGTRGNLVKTTQMVTATPTYIHKHFFYDIAGNVVKSLDAHNNQNIATIFDYSDRFGSPDGEARGNSGAPELGGNMSYAFPTKVTNALGQETHTQFDYYTGKPVDSEDLNGIISSSYYNDPLDRLTQVISAVNVPSLKNQSTIIYNDNDKIVTTTTDLSAYGDNKLKSEVVLDGLGRTIETRSYENSTDYIRSYSEYDALGRIHRSSNPHRLNESVTWSRSSYDSLGRVLDIENPDNSHLVTQYSGNQVAVWDQAGKKRKSETDALGRVIKVTEDPGVLNYETTYSYDVLGNLQQVNQGAQTRTFIYDSLSRLVSATNPESGPITYSYDPNGNLIEKTDARGVKATMGYDALSRIKRKEYSGISSEATTIASNTPIVNYYYDDYSTLPSGAPVLSGGALKGRLVGVTYGSGTNGTYYKYDSVGRLDTSHQRIGAGNYATSYFYDLAGNVTGEKRNKRWNTMNFDGAGRLSSLSSSAYPYSSTNIISTDIKYTPSGSIQSETYGNGLLHNLIYNNRQQPTEIMLGASGTPRSILWMEYFYGVVNDPNGADESISLNQNNGNLGRIKSKIDGVLSNSQTYQYDGLNRLRYAVEHNNGIYNDTARAWFQTFDYDRYGNRSINVTNTSDNADAGNSALQLSDFSETNNRIIRSGVSYDLAGNLINESGKTYTYDAENRLLTATLEGGAKNEYVYDGIGRRVKKIVSGVTTRFEYGASGELLAEYNDSSGALKKEYIYRNGELIATKEPLKNYQLVTSDNLGSPRVWTDWNGKIIAGGRHDYLPFGEELFAGTGTRTEAQGYARNTQADGQRKQFTSKERDVETNLDYFHARYYSSSHGRFTSVDPLIDGATIYGPQGWNRYTYGLNNPHKYVDPDGKNPFIAGFLGGALVSGAIEAATAIYNGESLTDKKVLQRIAAKALEGGITGGVTAMTGNWVAGRAIAATVVASIGAGMISRQIDGDPSTMPLNPADAAIDSIASIAGNHVGHKVMSSVTDMTHSLRQATYEAWESISQGPFKGLEQQFLNNAKGLYKGTYNNPSISNWAGGVSGEATSKGLKAIHSRFINWVTAASTRRDVDCDDPRNRCRVDVRIVDEQPISKMQFLPR